MNLQWFGLIYPLKLLNHFPDVWYVSVCIDTFLPLDVRCVCFMPRNCLACGLFKPRTVLMPS